MLVVLSVPCLSSLSVGRKRRARERIKPTTMKYVKKWRCRLAMLSVVLVQLGYAVAEHSESVESISGKKAKWRKD